MVFFGEELGVYVLGEEFGDVRCVDEVEKVAVKRVDQAVRAVRVRLSNDFTVRLEGCPAKERRNGPASLLDLRGVRVSLNLTWYFMMVSRSALVSLSVSKSDQHRSSSKRTASLTHGKAWSKVFVRLDILV